MLKPTFKDFLKAQERGMYMTPEKFLRSLKHADYQSVLDSTQPGETLDSAVRRWAEVNAPDITIVDDDDGVDHGKDWWITHDKDED